MTANILIVDDEQNIRFFLSRLLQRDGYSVTEVSSGESALAEINKQEFDLVMLDVMMPGISGMEVMTRLHQKWPDTIVILLTAHAALETAVEALRHGAHDYLFKPCEAETLRKSVREGLLKRQQTMQQQFLLKNLEDNLASSLTQIRAAVSGSDIEPVSLKPSEEPKKPEQRFLKQGSLIIDIARHVITVEGHLIELSPIEFDLIYHLASRSPHIVSPQELVSEIQGYESDAWEASEITRAHIYRIRQKIRKIAGDTVDVIQTVRGIGYTIEE